MTFQIIMQFQTILIITFEFIPNNNCVHYHDSKQNTADPTLRRSERIRKPNPRYCNYDFVT